jgi:hypothetical protein
MADAAFKFNSPADISMRGLLFPQLLQVTAASLLCVHTTGGYRALLLLSLNGLHASWRGLHVR